MKHTIPFLLLLFSTASLFAQISIKGTVILECEGEAIGANIVCKDNPRVGTASDFDGTFRLAVDSLPATLRISYVGYEDQVVTVNDTSELYIELKMSPSIMGYTIVRVFYPIPSSRSLTYFLNNNIGVQVQNGALNTQRISIRGIGSRSPYTTAKLRAYLDGIPITSGVGETSLEDIPGGILSDTDVIKGPFDSTLGSSLGGTIDLQTAANEINNNHQLDLSSRIGSFGYARQQLQYRTQDLFEQGYLHAAYDYTSNEGYRANNQLNRHNFLLSLGQRKYDYSWGALALLTDNKAEIPSSLNEQDYQQNPRQAAPNWAAVNGREDYQKMIWGIHGEHRFDYKKHYFHQKYQIFGTAFQNDELRPFNAIAENAWMLGGKINWNWRFNKWETTLGTELFWEHYERDTKETLASGEAGMLLHTYSDVRQYHNVFLETSKNFGNGIRLEAGLNYNQSQYQLQETAGQAAPNRHRFQPMFSPRASLQYLWHRTNMRLFAQAAHGFNPPTIEESLTPAGNINTDIQPEKGWSFEWGVKRGEDAKKFNYKATFYYIAVEDLLVARRTLLDQYVGINAGQTSHLGMELELYYEWDWDVVRFFPFAHYHFAHYRFVDFVENGNDYSGNELTGTHPHQLQLGGRFNVWRDFDLSANYRYMSPMSMRDDNSIYAPAYQLVNADVSWEKYWSFSGKYRHCKNTPKYTIKLRLHAGCQNIFNEKYPAQILINASSFGGQAPRYYYPGLARNYYGGVDVSFSL